MTQNTNVGGKLTESLCKTYRDLTRRSDRIEAHAQNIVVSVRLSIISPITVSRVCDADTLLMTEGHNTFNVWKVAGKIRTLF